MYDAVQQRQPTSSWDAAYCDQCVTSSNTCSGATKFCTTPDTIFYVFLARPQFQFDCGNYSLSAELLQAYKLLCTSSERNLSVLWGKLAADTLMQSYDTASEDIQRLKEALDNQSFGVPPLMQLQQRTWLMHWSLHVFWNHENGKNALIDLFMSAPYLNAIQVSTQGSASQLG